MREPTPHLPSLDALRGIAVAMVVLFHVGEGASELPRLQDVLRLGGRGVDLFFVLSGFLITKILLETRGNPGYFRSFYLRRVLRIFPAYYLYLALLAIALSSIPTAQISRDAFARAWPWYALYLTNIKIIYFYDLDPASVQHLWSLAVEEHFYLVWPAVVALVPVRALLPFTCTVIAAVVVGRAVWLARGAEPIAVYMLSWTRADSLLVGGVIAMLQRDGRNWAFLTRASPLLGVVALAGSFLDAPSLRYFFIALFFAALLARCVSAEERGAAPLLLRSRVLQRLGVISYGVYLFHFFFTMALGREVKKLFGGSLTGFFVLLLAVSLATGVLAALSFRYVEKPALALKRRVTSSPRLPPAGDRIDPHSG